MKTKYQVYGRKINTRWYDDIKEAWAVFCRRAHVSTPAPGEVSGDVRYSAGDHGYFEGIRGEAKHIIRWKKVEE